MKLSVIDSDRSVPPGDTPPGDIFLEFHPYTNYQVAKIRMMHRRLLNIPQDERKHRVAVYKKMIEDIAAHRLNSPVAGIEEHPDFPDIKQELIDTWERNDAKIAQLFRSNENERLVEQTLKEHHQRAVQITRVEEKLEVLKRKRQRAQVKRAKTLAKNKRKKQLALQRQEEARRKNR